MLLRTLLLGLLLCSSALAATYTLTIDQPQFDQPYALDPGQPVQTVHTVSLLIEGTNAPLWYRCSDMGGDQYQSAATWWPRYVFGDDAILYDAMGGAPIGETVLMAGVATHDWSFLADGTSTVTLRHEQISMGWDCVFDHTDRTLDRLIITIDFTATVGNEVSNWETVKKMYR